MISGNTITIKGTKFVIGLTWKKLVNSSQYTRELKAANRTSGVLLQTGRKGKVVYQAGMGLGSASGFPSLVGFVSQILNDNVLLVHADQDANGAQKYWTYGIINGVLVPGTDKLIEFNEALSWVKDIAALAPIEINAPREFAQALPDLMVKETALETCLQSNLGKEALRNKAIFVKGKQAIKKEHMVAVGGVLVLAGAGLVYFLVGSNEEAAPEVPVMSEMERQHVIEDYAGRERKVVADSLGNPGFAELGEMLGAALAMPRSALSWQVEAILVTPANRSVSLSWVSGGHGLISDLLGVAPNVVLDQKREIGTQTINLPQKAAPRGPEVRVLAGMEAEYRLIDAARFAQVQLNVGSDPTGGGDLPTGGAMDAAPAHRTPVIDLSTVPPEVVYQPRYFQADYVLSGTGNLAMMKTLYKLNDIEGIRPTSLDINLQNREINNWILGVKMYVR